MKRRSFLHAAATLTTLPAVATQMIRKNKMNSIRLIRHATLVLEIGGMRILIDPMLSEKGKLDPVKNAANEIRIPMVDLPFGKTELQRLISSVHAIAVTHTHRDHWDVEAQQLIPKSKIIFCQPADAEKIRDQGFTDVRPIESSITLEKVQIHRTTGHHGTGEIGKQMGEVSGFIFIEDKSRIYIAGDTIWCTEVQDAIEKFDPTHIVVNSGGAQFLTGDPITMNVQDVIEVKRGSKNGKVIAVHMDVVNHCIVTRRILKEELARNKISVLIPEDGETVYV